MVDIESNLKDVNISDAVFEQTEVVEYEFSENISILYDKSTKQYRIEWLDQETFDEYVIEVEEPFEDLELDETVITKKDFEEFKELVLKSA